MYFTGEGRRWEWQHTANFKLGTAFEQISFPFQIYPKEMPRQLCHQLRIWMLLALLYIITENNKSICPLKGNWVNYIPIQCNTMQPLKMMLYTP